MITRKIAFAAAAVIALSPAISNASPEKISAKACASAFAARVVPASGTDAPAYKLAYRTSFGSALTDFYPTDYTFALEAHNPKTGAAIARAVCSVDSRGTVTGLTTTTLDSANTLAAR